MSFRNRRWSTVLAGLLTLALSATVWADEVEVQIDGMKSKTPAGWKEDPKPRQMRLHTFMLPKADGDTDATELAIFYFKQGSGSVEANLERQVKKFEPAEGKDKLDVTVSKIKLGKHEATYQDIQGTYLSKFPPFDPNAKITRKAGYRQLYVIFKGDSGEYYMTLLGPAKSVAKNQKDFEEWLKNFK